MQDDKIYTAVNKTIRLSRIHRKLIESRIGELGIARTAHRALMHISKRDRLLSQKALAEHLEITPAAVTGVLQRLEADGYIKRTLGCDNRYNEIEITEKGRETVELSCGLFREIDSSLFVGFTDGELDAYIAFLDRIRENAEKAEISENKENERILSDEKMV